MQTTWHPQQGALRELKAVQAAVEQTNKKECKA